MELRSGRRRGRRRVVMDVGFLTVVALFVLHVVVVAVTDAQVVVVVGVPVRAVLEFAHDPAVVVRDVVVVVAMYDLRMVVDRLIALVRDRLGHALLCHEETPMPRPVASIGRGLLRRRTPSDAPG